MRIVETPDGWITNTGQKPQFFVFVLRDFTGVLDAELASAIGVEAQRDSKYTTDARTLQTMLLRSEHWTGTGDGVRRQLLQLITPLLPGGDRSRETSRGHSGDRSSSSVPSAKLPKLSDSPAHQRLSLS